MKKIVFGMILNLALIANAGEPVVTGVPGLPTPVTSAIEVQFGDFGAGHSHRPQAAALDLVTVGIKNGTVGKYILRSVQHHGEISFCVEAAKGVFGAQGDLSAIYAQLDELQPDRGDMYNLELKVVSSCN